MINAFKKAAFGLLIIAVLYPFGIASGAGKEVFTVSPVSKNYILNSGEQTTGKITVTNSGESAIDFKLYAEAFSVNGEDYSQAFVEAPNAPSAAKWISFPQNLYTVKPGEQIEAEYSIYVDPDAAPGGHYAIIFTETVIPASNSNGVSRIKRIGTILYFEINGDLRRGGGIASFTADKWQTKRPITANLRLSNDGNVHYRTQGTITLKNVLTGRKTDSPVNGTILPSTTRSFKPVWENAGPIGLYKISGSTEVLGEQVSLPEQWVLLLPALYVYIIIGVLLAMVIIITVLKRRKRSKRSVKT